MFFSRMRSTRAMFFLFFQAEDCIRDFHVTGVQTCALPISAFGTMKPADLAGVLHDYAPKRRHEIAAALDDSRLADVLEELPEEDQVGILEEIGTRRAAAVLAEMAPDDAADLV